MEVLKKINKIKKIFTRSFPLRLSLVVLGLVSLLFALAFAGNSTSARRYVQRESIERAQSALENTILRINAVLRSVEVTIHNMSWLVQDNLDKPENIYQITGHIIKSNDFITGSAVAFEPYYYEQYGLFYSPYSYRDGDTVRSKQLGTDDYDYHYMDWYQIPRLLDTPYWSEPYYDEGGGNVIMTTYSYPIKDRQGNLVAIFTADLSLEWFAEQVNSIKPYPNAYNIMIGRGGTFLVHDKKEYILTETIFAAAKESGDKDFFDTAHKMVDGEKGMGEFERQGMHFDLFYAPIDATGWAVAVACLHSDIFSGVDSVRKLSYMVGIAGLLLMTLICFFTIRRMTRPLTMIADSVTEIAKGNLSARLPVVEGNDEIRRLHDSFADMQKSLQAYIEELKSTTANRERIESELRIARGIQLGMVPKVFPPFPNRKDIDLFATMQPAREVGGDLYDYFIEDEKLHFIIGDVSGKGIPASLVMAVICRLFRTVASYINTPEGIADALNNAISESNDTCMFCTAFIGILDLKSGLLRYCNAGHNPPMVLEPLGGARLLEVVPNMSLGIWPGFDYKGDSCRMERGASLFLYTDGVTEAEDSSKKLYGVGRLLDLMQQQSSLSPSEIIGNVLKDIALHVKGAEPSDDTTILCCKYNAVADEVYGKSIVLYNRIDEIARMASFLEETGADLKLSSEVMFNIHLALEEAVTNVIMYAYPDGGEHEILLDVHCAGNELTFRITDTGKEFDPTLQPDADVTLPLEERMVGGLGIFLIRRVMQKMEYCRDDGKNILTLVKNLENGIIENNTEK